MKNTHINTLLRLTILVIVLTVLLAACGSNSTPAQDPGPGNVSVTGQTLLDERCSVCHSTSRITSAHKTVDDWTVTVDRMIIKGAQLDTEEKRILIDYLAANFK